MSFRAEETQTKQSWQGQSEAEAAREQATRLARRRGRLQMMLALACAVGVFAGARLAQIKKSPALPPLTEQALAGTWKLQSVNNDPVGPEADSVVLSQQVTFQNGKLQGETKLRADTNAATTAMPFPDESVSEVQSSADGKLVTVRWEGRYFLVNANLVELHIGKATYRATLCPDAKTHTLAMDHDLILTYKGGARYAVAAPQAPNQTANLARP